MAATARMILHVDPAEKARWTVEAKKAGISTSEFVRRAAGRYDPDLVLTVDEGEAMAWATAEITASAERMAANLDAMRANLAEFHDPDWYEKIRREVRAELEAMKDELNLDRLRDLLAPSAMAA